MHVVCLEESVAWNFILALSGNVFLYVYFFVQYVSIYELWYVLRVHPACLCVFADSMCSTLIFAFCVRVPASVFCVRVIHSFNDGAWWVSVSVRAWWLIFFRVRGLTSAFACYVEFACVRAWVPGWVRFHRDEDFRPREYPVIQLVRPRERDGGGNERKVVLVVRGVKC